MAGFFKKAYAFGISLLDVRKNFYRKRYILFEKDLASSLGTNVSSLVRGMELKIVSELRLLENLILDGYDVGSLPILADLKDGLKRRGVLFLVLDGKRCAHASLVVMNRAAAVSSDPLYKNTYYDKAGYIGPCYTYEAYRGKGIYPYVLSEICAFLKDKGMARALINTKTTNLASVKGITKAGFKGIAEIDLFKMLFLEFQKRSGCKSYGI